VLQRETNYEMFKEVMLTYSIPSQVITARNGNKFNLSKATNILRQINSKAGGDLYHLKFPPVLEKKRTMLIGIDVCHAGAQSVVGFSASINPDKSQYYSNYIIQRKGQEIVKEKMNDYLEEAIASFNNLHKGYPTNFVIYRDGVGDAQRDQVLRKEIPQFEEAINKLYNKASSKPEITVVVVNKRISQRFFMVDKNGRKVNPPPGCIIDQTLVQDHEPNSPKFDFFMTPALCTQGCVLPTHFYVPKNDSCMSKKDIQQLTYTLCYYYFNWAGSIKVPAPCQYAHKIAEFYTNINVHRKKQGLQICGKEALAVKNKLEASSIVPINNRLHFL
jgi:argonaute-like protein implicated in RNA metabolism and viral defense